MVGGKKEGILFFPDLFNFMKSKIMANCQISALSEQQQSTSKTPTEEIAAIPEGRVGQGNALNMNLI